MSVTVKVNFTNLSLVHKGSNGFVRCTLPDVCKTPSPGGPVPLPYPVIFSFSTDLRNGTTTVKADGGNMIAIKGSEFSRCTGDEPGTAGGVVSNTNMREAKWLLYSFDVKMDGKNACRLTDKMTMNHGNTVCLGGEFQLPVLQGTSEEDLRRLAEQCNRRINRAEGYSASNRPSGRECTELGTKKHKCCEDAIKKYNETHPDSDIQSEVGFDRDHNRIDDDTKDNARNAAGEAYEDFLSMQMSDGLSLDAARQTARDAGVWINTYRSEGGAAFRADVLRFDAAGNIVDAYDFKFNCDDEGTMDESQRQNYEDFTGIADPSKIHVPGHMF